MHQAGDTASLCGGVTGTDGEGGTGLQEHRWSNNRGTVPAEDTSGVTSHLGKHCVPTLSLSGLYCVPFEDGKREAQARQPLAIEGQSHNLRPARWLGRYCRCFAATPDDQSLIPRTLTEEEEN